MRLLLLLYIRRQFVNYILIGNRLFNSMDGGASNKLKVISLSGEHILRYTPTRGKVLCSDRVHVSSVYRVTIIALLCILLCQLATQ